MSQAANGEAASAAAARGFTLAPALAQPGLGFLTQTAFSEYVRAHTLKTTTGSCRDYRAGANCDFEMDAANKDKTITTPLLILWGGRGPNRTDEFISVWWLATCGHYMQEEVPDLVYDHFVKFFTP
jgi:haloacetate dehalogenase